MKNHVTGRVVLMLVYLAGMAAVAGAAPTVLFQDEITGYDTSSTTEYTNLNASVYLSQDVGVGGIVVDDLEGYTTTLPNQFVSIKSGQSKKHTTVATDVSTSARYGQVLLRVAEKSESMRFALFSDTNPVFHDDTFYLVTQANSVLEVKWRTTQIKYNCHGAEVAVTWDDTQFQNITINYDLTAGTHEVYVDTTLLQAGMANGAFTSIESMAIGGAYNAAGSMGGLDYWHLLTSTSTAFTGAGTEYVIPEPATLTLLAAGACLTLLRRRRMRLRTIRSMAAALRP